MFRRACRANLRPPVVSRAPLRDDRNRPIAQWNIGSGEGQFGALRQVHIDDIASCDILAARERFQINTRQHSPVAVIYLDAGKLDCRLLSCVSRNAGTPLQDCRIWSGRLWVRLALSINDALMPDWRCVAASNVCKEGCALARIKIWYENKPRHNPIRSWLAVRNARLTKLSPIASG